jgi:hypothetical protein
MVGPLGRKLVVYERVFLGGSTPDGKPALTALAILEEHAVTVNIPPTGTGETNVPGAAVPAVPVPLNKPGENQELVFVVG